MLTNKDARTLSKIIAEPGLFPEVRKQFTRELLDYSKELLDAKAYPPIPVPRRGW